jgi:radical SAM superfamily enzyme
MDIKNIKEWNLELTNYLKQIGEYSQIYSLLHKISEKKYNKISYCMDIPNIIISTVAGTLSISSSGLFSGMEKEASVFIGILSLTSSILTTINSYFGFKKRSENHRLVSIQYQKIYLKIDLILGLKNDERPPITEFIKFITDEYNRLSEISPIIDKEILNEFKEKYNDYKNVVSFPAEMNGLSPITIYKEEFEKELEEIKGEEDII